MLILLPPSERKAVTPVAAPAMAVYAGVLYEALDWASLNKSAKAKGEKSIKIISAKYGAIAPSEKIKSYKAKIDNKKIAPKVVPELDSRSGELIIDCRSSTYQGVWEAPYGNTVEIRVFQNVNGAKKVITHMSKKTRGEVVRLILNNSTIPKSPRDVRDIINAKYSCALIKNDDFRPWVLEVIAKEPVEK